MTFYSILVLFVAPILATLSRKYLEPHLPEGQKVLSSFKKARRFVALYLFPIAAIILTAIFYKNVDKLFVIAIASEFTVLAINLLGAEMLKHAGRINDIYLRMIRDKISDLSKKLEGNNKFELEALAAKVEATSK